MINQDDLFVTITEFLPSSCFTPNIYPQCCDGGKINTTVFNPLMYNITVLSIHSGAGPDKNINNLLQDIPTFYFPGQANYAIYGQNSLLGSTVYCVYL